MRKPANAREQGDFDRINTAFDRITMAAAARRLLAYRGIDVTVSVKALDEDAAAAIAASLTEADINTELEKAGLPPATVLAAAAVGESEGDSGELPDGFIHAWSNEYERKYFYNVATGESSWEKPQTAAIYPKLPECWTAVWSHEEERYYFDSTTGEITWEKPDSSACPPEEVDDARWRAMHEDARATAADRNLIEQIRRNYRAFLAEAKYCDQLGDYCEGRLCRCKRRAGRHLCYKMDILWQDDCKVASKVKPCEDLSVTEVKDMCTVMEKLPGVNVDHWPIAPKVERGESKEQPNFFFAPEGVYE